MIQNYTSQAIQAVLNSRWASCKFLSANDTGLTGAHQSGIYISKSSYPILFDKLGEKGSNMEKRVKIKWQNDWETDSRFIYYGRGTRDEYRITNFGKDFPFLRPDYTGALFVLTQNEYESYCGFVLNTEDEINQFLDAFGLTPAETNRLIDVGRFGFFTLAFLRFPSFCIRTAPGISLYLFIQAVTSLPRVVYVSEKYR